MLLEARRTKGRRRSAGHVVTKTCHSPQSIVHEFGQCSGIGIPDSIADRVKPAIFRNSRPGETCTMWLEISPGERKVRRRLRP